MIGWNERQFDIKGERLQPTVIAVFGARELADMCHGDLLSGDAGDCD
jgi:hypothetical protein